MNILKTISYKSDSDTINSSYGNMYTLFHYNFIENVIMQNLASCESVLDVGSGYGHWIEFYKEIYSSDVDFIDISKRVQINLRMRYDINGHCGSIHKFNKGKYEVINAIGVLHHIMNDNNLIKAIDNLKSMSDTIIVGTAFDLQRNDKHRRFRPLEFWEKHLGVCEIFRPRPNNCKSHLNVLIYKS